MTTTCSWTTPYSKHHIRTSLTKSYWKQALETETQRAGFLHRLLTFCLSPVRWANSTISLPNWLKICTNSWKVLTLSRWSRVTRTWEERQNQSGNVSGNIWFVFFCFIHCNDPLLMCRISEGGVKTSAELHKLCLHPRSKSILYTGIKK